MEIRTRTGADRELLMTRAADLGVRTNQSSIVRWLGATRLLCPSLNISPVPDECGLERRYWLGEVGVPSTPLVNNLGALHPQSLRDLVCANEIG